MTTPTAIPVLYVGAAAPESLVVIVTSPGPSGGGPDLSTVTSAIIRVKKGAGSVVNWTAAMSAQSATSLTLTYAFASGGTDVVIGDVGAWWAYAIMTVPAGTIRSVAQVFQVLSMPGF